MPHSAYPVPRLATAGLASATLLVTALHTDAARAQNPDPDTDIHDEYSGALPISPADWDPPVYGADLDRPPERAGDKIIFINFDGGEMQWCSSGPQNNCSGIHQGTVLPFTGDSSKRASIVQIVRSKVSAYSMTVTDTRPSSGDYDMEMVGDWDPPAQGGFAGVAPGIDCYDSNGGQVSFSLEYTGTSDGMAEVILQEMAHTWGLEHIDSTSDLLYPTTQGSNKEFVDECLQIVTLDSGTGSTSPTTGECQSLHNEVCGDPNMQNSHKELLEVFGPGEPDTVAPTMEILSPADGEQIEKPDGKSVDVDLVVDLDDNNQPVLFNFSFVLDGPGLDEPLEHTRAYAGPAELTFPITIPAGDQYLGTYTIDIEVLDEVKNAVEGSVSFEVVPASGGGDPGDDGSTDTGDGSTGTGGDGSTDSDGGDDGSTDSGNDGSDTGDGSTGTDDGSGDGGSGDGGSSSGGGADEDTGCACRTQASDHAPAGLLALGLLALGFRRRGRA